VPLRPPLKGSRNLIALTVSIHDEFDDWRLLLDSLASQPTHIRKIIPDFPTWTGAHNASGRGMGGVFAGLNGTPYLWCHPWSPTEAARLFLSLNPVGNLSINNSELAGNAAQLWLVLPKMAPLSAIVLNGSDNLTSIWWIRNGSTNTYLPHAPFSVSAPGCSASTALPLQQPPC
jgi:hypothetical protein